VQTSDNPVEINQEIQLGSVKFKLEAIEKNQYGGYSFLFNGADGGVVQCVVELAGHPTNMSGGSSFNQGDPFHFYQSVMYRQIPTGMLTVRVSQPAVLGDPQPLAHPARKGPDFTPRFFKQVDFSECFQDLVLPQAGGDVFHRADVVQHLECSKVSKETKILGEVT